MHLMIREANESHERRARCFLAHPTITNARTISWTLGSITYSPTLTASNVFHSVSPFLRSCSSTIYSTVNPSAGLGIVPSRFVRPDSPSRPCTRSSGGRFRSGFTRDFGAAAMDVYLVSFLERLHRLRSPEVSSRRSLAHLGERRLLPRSRPSTSAIVGSAGGVVN
jgi:hypothetical protein